MVSFGTDLQCRCKADNWELEDGDGVEWELWVCQQCKEELRVPIEITRYFKDVERRAQTTIGDLKYLTKLVNFFLFFIQLSSLTKSLMGCYKKFTRGKGAS
mgnify:CR=1 FL=1